MSESTSIDGLQEPKVSPAREVEPGMSQGAKRPWHPPNVEVVDYIETAEGSTDPVDPPDSMGYSGGP